ncbi:MAG: hypothetical protein JWQ71_3902 [Pedosphaera sp.]|nr:hypothetical protein [Pedosphaera sp.]
MQSHDKLPMKVVGRKGKPKGGLEAADNLLQLVIALRGNKPFIPKGVHRFKTFEEAQAWSIKMMARRSSPAPQN